LDWLYQTAFDQLLLLPHHQDVWLIYQYGSIPVHHHPHLHRTHLDHQWIYPSGHLHLNVHLQASSFWYHHQHPRGEGSINHRHHHHRHHHRRHHPHRYHHHSHLSYHLPPHRNHLHHLSHLLLIWGYLCDHHHRPSHCQCLHGFHPRFHHRIHLRLLDQLSVFFYLAMALTSIEWSKDWNLLIPIVFSPLEYWFHSISILFSPPFYARCW